MPAWLTNRSGSFTDVPEGAKFLKYSLGEIICPTCQEKTDLAPYDFVQEKPVASPPASPVHETQVADPPAEQSFGSGGYFCECGQELDSIESFTAHRETCTKAKPIPG